MTSYRYRVRIDKEGTKHIKVYIKRPLRGGGRKQDFSISSKGGKII